MGCTTCMKCGETLRVHHGTNFWVNCAGGYAWCDNDGNPHLPQGATREVLIRDPQRIPQVLDELKRVWETYPDLRLCQLIVNLGDPTGRLAGVYYVEDDALLAALEGE